MLPDFIVLLASFLFNYHQDNALISTMSYAATTAGIIVGVVLPLLLLLLGVATIIILWRFLHQKAIYNTNAIAKLEPEEGN